MGSARAEDNYVLRGAGDETYEPRFTYRGFQYVEVSGFPETTRRRPGEKPPLDIIEGKFIHDGVRAAGFFECGNDLIDRIHLCTVQTQRMNLQMGVPTDDTQRAERLGWGADALVSAEEAMLNFHMAPFYAKWMGDFRDQQEDSGRVGMIAPRPGIEEDLVWSSAFVLIPWLQFVRTGDRRILEENYDAIARYLNYLATQGRADVKPRRRGSNPLFEPPVNDSPKGHLQWSQWGDHVSLADGFSGRSDLPLSISTAFYYYDVATMAKIARVLGRRRDASRYARLASDVRDAFNRKFFDARTNSYDDGSQAAQAFPLSFGMVPQGRDAAVLRTLLTDMHEPPRRAPDHRIPGDVVSDRRSDALRSRKRNMAAGESHRFPELGSHGESGDDDQRELAWTIDEPCRAGGADRRVVLHRSGRHPTRRAGTWLRTHRHRPIRSARPALV